MCGISHHSLILALNLRNAVSYYSPVDRFAIGYILRQDLRSSSNASAKSDKDLLDNKPSCVEYTPGSQHRLERDLVGWWIRHLTIS